MTGTAMRPQRARKRARRAKRKAAPACSRPILEGEDFLLDEHGHVYQYDISTDLCLPSAETQAFTGTGLPMRYDPDCASVEYVID